MKLFVVPGGLISLYRRYPETVKPELEKATHDYSRMIDVWAGKAVGDVQSFRFEMERDPLGPLACVGVCDGLFAVVKVYISPYYETALWVKLTSLGFLKRKLMGMASRLMETIISTQVTMPTRTGINADS